MTGQVREPTLRDRLDDRPRLNVREALGARPRDLGIRFFAGAFTSVCAGVVTLTLGPRPGGILLAFPAILAASLTLIEEQEDSVDAREDARGAIAGGVAMIVFAVIATVAFGHLPGGWALAIAAGAWLATALLLYLVFWWR